MFLNDTFLNNNCLVWHLSPQGLLHQAVYRKQFLCAYCCRKNVRQHLKSYCTISSQAKLTMLMHCIHIMPDSVHLYQEQAIYNLLHVPQLGDVNVIPKRFTSMRAVTKTNPASDSNIKISRQHLYTTPSYPHTTCIKIHVPQPRYISVIPQWRYSNIPQ